MEDMERDFIELEDENGNTLELDIVEYFDYEDEHYAILTDFSKVDELDYDAMSDEEIEAALDAQEFYILKVVTEGETEEFVEPDEDKMEALTNLAEEILNSDDCCCEDDDCDCHHCDK